VTVVPRSGTRRLAGACVEFAATGQESRAEELPVTTADRSVTSTLRSLSGPARRAASTHRHRHDRFVRECHGAVGARLYRLFDVNVRADARGYDVRCESGATEHLDSHGAPLERAPFPAEPLWEARAETRLGTVIDDAARSPMQPLAKSSRSGSSTPVCEPSSRRPITHGTFLKGRAGRHALLATGGSWIAASLTPSHAAQLTADVSRRVDCHGPSTFSGEGGALHVVAISVEPDGRALVALPDGAPQFRERPGLQAG
jgi:hypothetical protein